MESIEKTFEGMDAMADGMKESAWSEIVAEFRQAVQTRFLRINEKCNNEQQMNGEKWNGA